MTIDEAIAKYKEIANTDASCPRYCMCTCDKCVHESEQLAEWLEELKELRLQNHLGRDEALIAGRKEGYNKAIDDFVKRIDGKMPCDICDGAEALFHIEELAEQLKAGVGNGT